MNALRIGIDVGGTFTDVVVETAQGDLVGAFKVSTTPADPAQAVIAALDRVRGGEPGAALVEVCHGTTVGTNCLIERRGARTALVTTRGFRDVIELRRQARPLLFALTQKISEPLVARAHRFELDERVAFDGEVLAGLDATGMEAIIAALQRADIEAVAVSLINGYANPAHERALKSAIEAALPGVFVSAGSDIAPEYGEFERTSTAVVNCYIGPRVRRYVERLDRHVRAAGAQLLVAKSNGGLTSPAGVVRHPVHAIESGPAAGVVASAAFARVSGRKNLIAFDMGGTTSKVGLVRDGVPAMARELIADRYVDGRDQGGYPVRSQVIDLIEIGAGGGSLAWLDHARVIRIGPRSAGSLPGPACYGRGGDRPTLTDAHVAVGNLVPAAFAQAGIVLQPHLAERAIERSIAGPLGWTAARAAHAILRVAIARIAELVRLATVRRGIDPRDFALLAYGGAAALHAADVAREVGVPTVLVPPLPGMFSARGTLRAQVRHDVSRSVLRRADAISAEQLDSGFAELEADARARLAADLAGRPGAAIELERSLDVRYEGQLFELTVVPERGVLAPNAIADAFRRKHRDTYGYDLAQAAVQLVNLRVTAHTRPRPYGAGFGASLARLPQERAHTAVGPAGERVDQPLLARDALAVGEPIRGPALVSDHGATVLVPSGCHARVDALGWLEIDVRPA